MVVAATGGTGFVGNRLVRRHLAAGDRVRVLTRRAAGSASLPDAVSLYRGDLTDGAHALKPFVDGADVLYHCAAELRDESRMHAVHVHGTRNLVEAAEQRIGRLVLLSSVGVYGRTPGGFVAEDSPLRPEGAYETTKGEAERVVREAAVHGTMKCSILRPSKVFGPEMRPQDLYQLIAVIDRGWFFFIGEAGAVANYAHVDNVVEGLLCCATLPQAVGGIYNLSDWRPLEEFIAIIAAALGRRAPALRIPETAARWMARLLKPIPGFPLTESRIAGLVNRTIYVNARIERELGYAHSVTMEEGLRQMVQAWREQRGRYGRE
jgi:nucleoside-diphosphate-sugar epimerase